ncbi:hypothetical protein [Citricoccus alkalitolerans]|uniref:Uncharacterized protein n=1 Tax=Citricoccus alkalitolerans TaxID=246603 RepID=A0ABV8XUY8_9MICC
MHRYGRSGDDGDPASERIRQEGAYPVYQGLVVTCGVVPVEESRLEAGPVRAGRFTPGRFTTGRSTTGREPTAREPTRSSAPGNPEDQKRFMAGRPGKIPLQRWMRLGLVLGRPAM